ncbi:MAG TPA: isoprenylcysteine carboxylmethyltransferase family protein [Ignavibacteria bacterium]|nr:isoprenylcysteine carboxylmethyltransferase family protein [Ignavibacteria bacterium]HMQ98056.1 isoprenylcysteine carboxylmethyltransferase family protein [Ignavibacteria bacterium]
MTDKAKGWVLVVVQFILLAVVVISSVYEFKYSGRELMPAIHYIGVTLILIGALLFTFILISFGQYMTPNPVPRDNSVLKTTGIYSLIRHPMYFTVLVLLLGVILYFQAFYSLAWLVIAFFFLVFKTTREESYLAKKFPEYTAYRKVTKRILPFIY